MTNPDDMTKEEMVRFLAVKVMGWKRWGTAPSRDGTWHEAYWGDAKGNKLKSLTWNPLTIPADRDMLVEVMWEKGWFLGLQYLFPDDIEAEFTFISESGKNLDAKDSMADTPGEAVCRAAVKAVMAQKESSHE